MPMAITLPRSVASVFDMPVNSRKRGRRSGSIEFRAKLERSRQSARECRARKKIRYQYLEELLLSREKAIYALRDELNTIKQWCIMVDCGEIPSQLITYLNKQRRQQQTATTDGTAPTSECLQNYLTNVGQMGHCTEDRFDQNVISADSRWPIGSSSLSETVTNSATAVMLPDLDQQLEDWTDILQCCDFSPAGAV